MFGLSVCCITLFWTAGVSHSVRVAKMNRNWLILRAVQLIRSLVTSHFLRASTHTVYNDMQQQQQTPHLRLREQTIIVQRCLPAAERSAFLPLRCFELFRVATEKSCVSPKHRELVNRRDHWWQLFYDQIGFTMLLGERSTGRLWRTFKR